MRRASFENSNFSGRGVIMAVVRARTGNRVESSETEDGIWCSISNSFLIIILLEVHLKNLYSISNTLITIYRKEKINLKWNKKQRFIDKRKRTQNSYLHAGYDLQISQGLTVKTACLVFAFLCDVKMLTTSQYC